jgi:ferredoxin-NADP reductase
MTASGEFRVRVAEVETVAAGIRRLKLVPIGLSDLPDFSGGAHTILSLADGDRTLRNPYSLMSSPYDTSCYEVSVLRTPDSRGGSAFIHEKLREGTPVTISAPVNLFPVDRRARRHILIAGGIGITPFMSMMRQLEREEAPFELHYGMRSQERGAYWRQLRETYGHRAHVYFEDQGLVIPLATLLDGQPLGTHLYVCGPSAMIDWVLEQARAAGWPAENVHYERFSAPPPGKPFTIELARSGRTVPVAPHQSMLEALEAAGVDAPYLCRGGACGQCETRVVSCASAFQHNDHFLSDAERAAGNKIMTCISRIDGGTITLDL